jgi:hypothetical protein
VLLLLPPLPLYTMLCPLPPGHYHPALPRHIRASSSQATGALTPPPRAWPCGRVSWHAERPGHGRYKLPTLKVAARLPGTKQWTPTASWAASTGAKKGATKDAFFGTTAWMEDAYSRKWDAESAYRKSIEDKVLFGNFKPPSGSKSLRTMSSKVTSQPAPGFFKK